MCLTPPSGHEVSERGVQGEGIAVLEQGISCPPFSPHSSAWAMDFFMICAVAWSIIALLGTDGLFGCLASHMLQIFLFL